MRILAILLGIWLGCASGLAQSSDKTAAGLRKLREVCFPKVRTARLVECAWFSEIPAILQVWQNSPGSTSKAWLVNETPVGGTLLFACAVPIEVIFKETPDSSLPRVRCSDLDLTKHLHDLESEIQDTESAGQLGTGLLLAVLADASGAREQAVKLAQSIFSKSENMAMPIISALNVAAYGQYAGFLIAYQRTGDIAAFRRDCESLMKRFPEGWSGRSIIPTILSELPMDGKSVAPPELSGEDQKLLEEIRTCVPTESASLLLFSQASLPWLFEPPSTLEVTPLKTLFQKGPAAVPFLVAVSDYQVPTRFVGGPHGLHGLAGLLSMNPSEEEMISGSEEFLLPMMPRPLTVGQLSRLFLTPMLQLTNPHIAIPSVQTAAKDWLSRYGNLEGAELLRALLKNKTPEEQFGVLAFLLDSQDAKWLPVYEEFIDAQANTQEGLQIATILAQRPDKRFHSVPRKFLAKLKSKDDLLPEFIRNNSVPEEAIKSFREQIDRQLEIIHKALGEPESTPPSA